MYVAAKGGERAIDAAHDWLAAERRGDAQVPQLTVAQIREQMTLAVDRVMAEGALHDPDLAAMAIRQARGDLIEAVHLIRAHRTTLPRLGVSEPVETAAMHCDRRVSAIFKDAPGGQVLGPTFDYTHRLIDEEPPEVPEPAAREGAPAARRPVTDHLARDALIRAEPEGAGEPADITREPPELPMGRDARLQALARADEGFLLGMAYSTQRGHGRNHAFVGELRSGVCEVEMDVPGVGRVVVGEVHLTEVQSVNQFQGSRTEPAQFTRGYGLSLGRGERRAIAMALVDRALASEELGEAPTAPAQDQEFVLMHCDNVQATGFLEHIKLPHHVDFQAELELVRRLRAEAAGDAEQNREAAE